MKHEWRRMFDEALAVGSFGADSATISDVSRPRLWWTNAPISHSKPTYDRYRYNERVREALSLSGGTLHNDILTNKATIACFTTPAPDDAGRPPPKGSLRSCSPGAIG